MFWKFFTCVVLLCSKLFGFYSVLLTWVQSVVQHNTIVRSFKSLSWNTIDPLESKWAFCIDFLTEVVDEGRKKPCHLIKNAYNSMGDLLIENSTTQFDSKSVAILYLSVKNFVWNLSKHFKIIEQSSWEQYLNCNDLYKICPSVLVKYVCAWPYYE